AQLAATCARWLRHARPATPASAPAVPVREATAMETLVRRLQEQLGESDEGFARDLLGRYLSVTDDIVVDMRQAADAGDRTAIQQLAHRLRGSSATVCADAIAEAARTLEHLPSSAEAAEVRGHIDEIERHVADLRGLVHAG
nr:Hpt domain-containing protein [Gemmatimonadaceae bacterium]